MRNVQHQKRKKRKEMATPVEKRFRKAGSSANAPCHVSLRLGGSGKARLCFNQFLFSFLPTCRDEVFTAEQNREQRRSSVVRICRRNPPPRPVERHACALTCVNTAAGTEALQMNTALPIRRSRRRSLRRVSCIFHPRRSVALYYWWPAARPSVSCSWPPPCPIPPLRAQPSQQGGNCNWITQYDGHRLSEVGGVNMAGDGRCTIWLEVKWDGFLREVLCIFECVSAVTGWTTDSFSWVLAQKNQRDKKMWMNSRRIQGFWS